ncbi:MAG: aspartate--tRNA ligase [Candidatus Thermoplasmatota archaeon]|jgi:aspartyl-tRNA synthetase|nr:aspartate--tRNA ligase [Candidatus Thermoplasmatota archaeon]MDP7265751.1 aspartate--tRNA ligase [Candidatus Thermoplasmatota archaeon]
MIENKGERDGMLGNWRRTHFCGDIWKYSYGRTVVVAGWVHDIRNLGGVAFLQIRDRTGSLQITLEKSTIPEIFDALVGLSRESVIMVEGTVTENPQAPRGFEIIPGKVKVLAESAVPLPLGVADKVFAELDTRLDNRFLDLRKREIYSIFKIKHEILDGMIRGLHGLGFVQVQTPKIVATATEGGTELFGVDYFDNKCYLNQSPQLYKQMLMGAGFDRIFEIGPVFRAEEHDTVRHLNEFISIDIEMSFADEWDAIDVLEKVVRIAVERASECRNEIESINDGRKTLNKLINKVNMNIGVQNKRIKKDNQRLKAAGEELKPLLKPKEKYDALDIKPIKKTVLSYMDNYNEEEAKKSGMPRVKYEECIDIAQRKRVAVEFGDDLSMEAMKTIEEVYPSYYFITHWPTEIKPFYVQPYENTPEVCRSFDLNFGSKEITSGAQRVHDISLLESNLVEKNLDPKNFDFYLAPFRFGMPPHSGWGLGLERLMMVLTGMRNVREVVLFPRDRYRVIP